jgi:hypothetical protein
VVPSSKGDPLPGSWYAQALGHALVALRFREGERFELAGIREIDGQRDLDSVLFTNEPASLATAAQWIARHDGVWNVYVSSNPIRPEARPASGRPKDEDVACVRCLLVDPDPDDVSPPSRAAAASLADEVGRFLGERLGVFPVLIDSGRGRQLWLATEAMSGTYEVMAVRRRLLHALAVRFERTGAKIDKAVHNASRLVRLPGTVNLKTGERASLLHPGNGAVATLAHLEQLARSLEGSSTTSTPTTSRAEGTPDRLNPEHVLAGVHEGERNTTLFRYACRLRGKNLARVEVERLVLVAAGNCQPPFPDEEARAVIESAFKFDIDPAKDEEALAQARTRAAEVVARTKADPGAVFEPDALATLALLRRGDPPTWARLRIDLRRSGVSLRDLDAALRTVPGAPPGPEPKDEGDTDSQSTKIVRLASAVKLVHTPDGGTYATVPVGDHEETCATRSTAFRRWLARRFYEEEGVAPSSQALNDALVVIDGRARFDAPKGEVAVRVGPTEGGVGFYVDLTNDQWEAVEVSAAGWNVGGRPSVRFRRPRGALALPRPEVPARGDARAAIDLLRPFVNVADDGSWYLLVAWLLAALRPRGPYPILVFQGEHGSAKSTNTRLARSLVDPSASAVPAVESRNKRDAREAFRRVLAHVDEQLETVKREVQAGKIGQDDTVERRDNHPSIDLRRPRSLELTCTSGALT